MVSEPAFRTQLKSLGDVNRWDEKSRSRERDAISSQVIDALEIYTTKHDCFGRCGKVKCYGASRVLISIDSNFRHTHSGFAMRAIVLLNSLIVLLALSSNAQSAMTQKTPPTKKPERSSIGNVPTSIAASVGETLRFVEGEFLGVAEAMPEEKYDFVPTAGKFDHARTFREQVKHVACVQIALFNEFEGKQPPPLCEKGGPSSARTKAELIHYLKGSFDYSDSVVSQLTAANSLDRVNGRYAAPTTKLGISVASIGHVTDHYGQLVEYLRLNGIVPPVTQKYD